MKFNKNPYKRNSRNQNSIGMGTGGGDQNQKSRTNYSSPSSSSSSFFSHFWSSALRVKPLHPPSEVSVRTNSGDGLVRRLGMFDLILIGIGASIGAGIFVVTGTVARDAGPGTSLLNKFAFLFSFLGETFVISANLQS